MKYDITPWFINLKLMLHILKAYINLFSKIILFRLWVFDITSRLPLKSIYSFKYKVRKVCINEIFILICCIGFIVESSLDRAGKCFGSKGIFWPKLYRQWPGPRLTWTVPLSTSSRSSILSFINLTYKYNFKIISIFKYYSHI